MYSLDIKNVLTQYQQGALTPEQVCKDIKSKIQQFSKHNIWIHVLNDEELAPYLSSLKNKSLADLPLYGVPFAIKDNIDLANIPTTAACKEYSYTPKESAYVVQKLIDAGAIPIGKTNLDQFATGLVGTRSPYGAVKNAFKPEIISGGSSSGSAVSLALGMVSFSLGTDTAGSGRVPAALNNLIGLKPSKGRVSTRGVVPACRSLDCVNVFALNPDDTQAVFNIIDNYDDKDQYCKKTVEHVINTTTPITIGIPDDDSLCFFDNSEYEKSFKHFLEDLAPDKYKVKKINFSPFKKAAELLYQGPWIAERYAAIESFIENKSNNLFPVTHDIISPAKSINAVDTFKSYYQLQEYKRQADNILTQVDCIITPTIGTYYSIEEVNKDPIQTNSNLGYYTNFMNLLDYAALAIPAGFTESHFPFGVTLFSWTNSDNSLIKIAKELLSPKEFSMGNTHYSWTNEDACYPEPSFEHLKVAVCGAHLSGMALNHQLTEKGAVLLQKTKTSNNYRFYVLAGGPPYRPGLIRDEENGSQIDVEVWAIPIAKFGAFMASIPAPLGIGTIELESNDWVKGFICEPYAIKTAEEITELGNWREFIKKLS